jgi:hypothetical protein
MGAVAGGAVRAARAVARGHPEIRATHHKTWEVTREPAITGRATCVVGVDARFDPAEWGLLRGEVRIHLRVGGYEVHGSATVNPSHQVSERIVARRGDFQDPDTFAMSATPSAAGLPAELISALADPAVEVVLTATEVRPPPPLIIVAAAGGSAPAGRVGLLWMDADERVDLARPPAVFSGGRTVAATLADPEKPLPETARSWFAAARHRDARVLCATGPDREPATAQLVIATLLAAACSPVPVLRLGRWDRRPGRDGSRTTASPPAAASLPESVRAAVRALAVPAVLTAPATAAAQLVAQAPAPCRVAVPDTVRDLGVAVRWLAPADAAAALADRADEQVTVVVDPGAEPTALIPADAAVHHLVAAGVPARTVADALAPLGLDRRRVYRMLDRAGSPQDDPDSPPHDPGSPQDEPDSPRDDADADRAG